MRRANHDKVAAPNLVPCANCSSPSLSHRVCPSCGHYAGKAIIVKKQDDEAAAGSTPASE
jgi:large subunit ribosomal protein L32